MHKNFWWISAKLILLLAIAITFSQVVDIRSNFGVFAGGACGTITFIILFAMMRSKVASHESHVYAIDAPFFPVGKYPRGYWLTIGSSVVVGSSINLIINIRNLHAVQLFIGLLLLGAGMALSVVCVVASEQRGRR